MSTTTNLVSVEEYLHTSFEDGDREYIDGRIVERNMGEVDHADAQSSLLTYLRSHYRQFWTAVEVRVQVTASRFRVPDVSLVLGSKPGERTLSSAPFLVVEVLSKDDRADELEDKIDDYLSFGVKYVWVVNPRTGRGYIYTADGMHEAKDGVLRTSGPEIVVPLGEIFPRDANQQS